MKKYLIGASILTFLALASTVSAATGTGSEEKCEKCLPGGPTRAFNFTTNAWDMLPQCFPWVWRTDYLNGNIVAMYENQRICRENRAKDFRF